MRSSPQMVTVDDVTFDEAGLVPCIVQDVRTGEVLMLAYMNAQSLQRTVEKGETWFFSRSRQTLWNKGATSGNRQLVRSIRLDCDGDTLLVQVEQLGDGACHIEGNRTCFERTLEGGDFAASASFDILAELSRVIAERYRQRPEGSYTTRLFEAGLDRIAKKVGEEAVEVVLAAKNHERVPGDELALETADLVYHLMVLLQSLELPIDEVYRELRQRRPKRDDP